MRLDRLHGCVEQRLHRGRDVVIGADVEIETTAGAALQVRSDAVLKLRDIVLIKAVGRQWIILRVEDRNADAPILDRRAR